MSQSHERLRRLLFVVPFVAKNPGRSVDEVAQALGITRDELLEDLDLLTLVGRPPFQPDDFVDIYVDDGKVYVDLHQRLSAPPRLTAAEGVALAAAARLLEPAAGGALTQALSRLERVLPREAVERFRAMAKQLDVALEAPDGIATLSQAIVQHRQVEFDYFAAGRGQTERRAAQPFELFSHHGQWYLLAFCLTRNEQRLFRLDRVANLAVTDTRFEPPAEVSARMPGVSDADAPVVVRFSPQVAPYVRERFGDAAQTRPDGHVVVTVTGESERWLTRWVLSFGGDAVVESPTWAIRAVALRAQESLDSV